MIKIYCELLDENITEVDKFDIVINLNDTKICHYNYMKKDHLKFYEHYSKFITPIGLDLLNISLFVYFADKLVSRENAFNAWTRSINLSIPVHEIDKYEALKENFEELLKFLSGDYWNIEFRKQEFLKVEKEYNKIVSDNAADLNFDCISMLSGGLDSYIGAIDLLESGVNPLFVSHYGGGNDVTPYQNQVKKMLMDQYGLADKDFLSFHAKALDPVEQTTRTRSFMFFSHAIAVSTMFENIDEIIIPENGFISLNIPLTNSRLGSSSTRTTHPFYMDSFNNILAKLGITMRLRNPYQFKTKGEMIIECSNLDFINSTLHHTMSCSHSSHARWSKSDMHSHCGYCVPCIIRRASILKSANKDRSIYRQESLKLRNTMTKTIYSNINSFKFALTKYYSKKEHSFEIQHAGPVLNNIENYVKLYKRGMEEVAKLYYMYNEE